MSKPKSIALAGIALLVVLLIVGRVMRQGRNEALQETPTNTVAVRGIVLAAEPYERKIEESGVLVGAKESMIGAETGGQVVSFPVAVGDFVRQGEVLLRLDDDLYRLESERAKIAYDKAKMDLDRAEKLYAEKSISESDIENARLGTKGAEVAYEMALKTYNEATIRAPFSGTVAQKMTEVGQMVERGMPVVQLVDVSNLKLTVPVSESQIKLVTAGAPATVVVDAVEETIEGRVSSVGSRAATGSRMFPVEITIPGNARLRSGMFARAIIGSPKSDAGILLPRVALLPDAGKMVVFRAHSGTAEKVSVRMVGNSGDRIVVEGLAQGDTVVTTGNQALSHGTQIELTLDSGSAQ